MLSDDGGQRGSRQGERVSGAPATAGLGAEPPAARERSSIAPEVAPLSIVLVEDNEDLREEMKELLEEMGHSVEAAEDGEAGVELILRRRPAVAFVDIGLPLLDGCGVAERVRAELGRDRLRMVAMSGFGQPSDRRRSEEAGFDSHLVKPAEIETLQKILAFEDK